MNSTGLAGGAYNATVQFVSNDLTQNPLIIPVQLTVTGGGTVNVNVTLTSGWNLVSNPVLTALDSVRQLYPASSFEYAFTFDAVLGYVQRSRLENGVGYWAKFPGAVIQTVSGLTDDQDTVTVGPGWNIIGSLTSPVDTATITSFPAGLVLSPYYGFNNGYSPSATMVPGHAYWVKSAGTGILVMSSTVAGSEQPAALQSSPVLEGMSWIRISDSDGGSQTLYIGGTEQEAGRTELPPPGPEGMLDVRFESGRMMEALPSGSGWQRGIALRASAWPVTVEWEVKGDIENLRIADGV